MTSYIGALNNAHSWIPYLYCALNFGKERFDTTVPVAPSTQVLHWLSNASVSAARDYMYKRYHVCRAIHGYNNMDSEGWFLG